jgi:hypothetical protein
MKRKAKGPQEKGHARPYEGVQGWVVCYVGCKQGKTRTRNKKGGGQRGEREERSKRRGPYLGRDGAVERGRWVVPGSFAVFMPRNVQIMRNSQPHYAWGCNFSCTEEFGLSFGLEVVHPPQLAGRGW